MLPAYADLSNRLDARCHRAFSVRSAECIRRLPILPMLTLSPRNTTRTRPRRLHEAQEKTSRGRVAKVLAAWQSQTPFNKPDDFVFASSKLRGAKPRTGSMIVEDYLRPAALKAGVIKVVKGQTLDLAGNVLKKFGFHCFRHTLASFLLAQGNNPVLIKNLLRWSKISMLDTYGHVMTDEKIAAQGSMLERIMPKTNVVQ